MINNNYKILYSKKQNLMTKIIKINSNKNIQKLAHYLEIFLNQIIFKMNPKMNIVQKVF